MPLQYCTAPAIDPIGIARHPPAGCPDAVNAHPGLARVLDSWLAQAAALMSVPARNRLDTEGMAPASFALIGSRMDPIAGRIGAGNGGPGRLEPLLSISGMPVPAAFVADAPLLLKRLWRCLESLSAAGAGTYAAGFVAFLQLHSMDDLDALLAQAGHRCSAARLLAALGQLLQPVLDNNFCCLERSIVLPLPDDAVYADLVTAFWMHMITPFLEHSERELALFITRLDDRPVLVLGFHGAAPLTLCALMDRQAGMVHHVRVGQGDAGAEPRALQLAQPGLSLKAAQEYFYGAFLARR